MSGREADGGTTPLAEPTRRAQPRPAAGEGRVGERRRRAILKAATVQFASKGFEGTTIDAIAGEAELPRATVYYYFASKEQIYRAILGNLIAAWDAALDHLRPDAEPAEALTHYIRAKLDHARRNCVESRLFALEILGGAPFLTSADRAHMRSATHRSTAVVEAWIAAGKLRPVDPRHLFILLWSATQFYADFTILAVDALDRPRLSGQDFEAATETIANVVLKGLSI